MPFSMIVQPLVFSFTTSTDFAAQYQTVREFNMPDAIHLEYVSLCQPPR